MLNKLTAYILDKHVGKTVIAAARLEETRTGNSLLNACKDENLNKAGTIINNLEVNQLDGQTLVMACCLLIEFSEPNVYDISKKADTLMNLMADAADNKVPSSDHYCDLIEISNRYGYPTIATRAIRAMNADLSKGNFEKLLAVLAKAKDSQLKILILDKIGIATPPTSILAELSKVNKLVVAAAIIEVNKISQNDLENLLANAPGNGITDIAKFAINGTLLINKINKTDSVDELLEIAKTDNPNNTAQMCIAHAVESKIVIDIGNTDLQLKNLLSRVLEHFTDVEPVLYVFNFAEGNAPDLFQNPDFIKDTFLHCSSASLATAVLNKYSSVLKPNQFDYLIEPGFKMESKAVESALLEFRTDIRVETF